MQRDRSYLVPETAAKKGRQPGAGPAININDKRSLDPVALGDETEIIFGP